MSAPNSFLMWTTLSSSLWFWWGCPSRVLSHHNGGAKCQLEKLIFLDTMIGPDWAHDPTGPSRVLLGTWKIHWEFPFRDHELYSSWDLGPVRAQYSLLIERTSRDWRQQNWEMKRCSASLNDIRWGSTFILRWTNKFSLFVS